MARKMKDSGIPWVGKIPEDWEVTKTKRLLVEVKAFSSTGEELPLALTAKDGIVPFSEKTNKTLESATYVGKKIVRCGQIVLNRFKSRLFALSAYDGLVSPDYAVYEVKDIASAKYLVYVFGTTGFKETANSLAFGVGDGFSRLYTSDLFKLQVPLPPHSAQKRIAEYLDKTVGRIDGLREKISREIERLGDYKKSMISEAVCRGLDKTANMKDSGIPWVGKIPAGWEVKKIKYCFKATNTRGNSCLQLLSATQKYGMYPQSKLEGVVQVAEKTDLSTFKTVHVDDFVISLRSFQGGIERSDYEGVCSPAYQTFHSAIECDTLYFKFLFKVQGFISALNAITVGIREGKSINYSDVQNMYIPLPPLTEQKRIAEYIDKQVAKIDALIEKRKAELERLEALKRSIICECVTGKMEVAS